MSRLRHGLYRKDESGTVKVRAGEAMGLCEQPISASALRVTVNLLCSQYPIQLLSSYDIAHKTYWAVSRDDKMGRQCCLQATVPGENHVPQLFYS